MRDKTRIQHHNFVRHGHGFHLVMGNVNHGAAQFTLQFGNF
ncbi:Uncharacterised protein [Vibrio cholerae]|nr:Uncharacterised protein [Vibrio cholerae]